ncbi:hypothetical protein PC9H_011181 [Pleurotus ostreatus]|uniref:Uncharacterized protein n=1 Tax=Pleurotus ostreatus TaxID=5322 RepID=A0A8H6ZL70_PLEOS|nr:uncharacterized protein PC9H_011181 [Pleurotus ostreatus]KAF7423017.1 hypothetical protein PC9H_011181 [Pleurotus ostreatus]KAJ8690979.1 hypothetical protein PTI98_010596 [Pleurotus ostreatus]
MASKTLSKPVSLDSSSDDEAPESFTLSTSKSISKQQTARLAAANASVKSKKKEKNRERDRKLKERAEATRGEIADSGRAGDDEEGDEVTVRELKQRKAQAEEEVQNGDNAEDIVDRNQLRSSLDAEDDGDEPALSSIPKRLPDHLFKSAFSQSLPSTSTSSTSFTSKPSEDRRKRKTAAKRKAKDLIVGSRVIRTLSATTTVPDTSRTIPSAKVRKFVDRNLALKASKRSKSWQRVPANLGVMKRNGPAARFVRNPVPS